MLMLSMGSIWMATFRPMGAPASASKKGPNYKVEQGLPPQGNTFGSGDAFDIFLEIYRFGRSPMNKLKLFALAAVAALGLQFAAPVAMAQNSGPLVFAASSLKDALDDINNQWQKETGKKATI